MEIGTVLGGRRTCGRLRAALFWVTTQRVVGQPIGTIFKDQESKKDFFFWFMALPNNPEERTFHILLRGSPKSPRGGLYCTRKWIVEFPGRCVFYSLAERLCCWTELLKCVVSLVLMVNETVCSQGQKYTPFVFEVVHCLATCLGNPPVLPSQILLLFVRVFLSLSMYTYCYLCILRRGYPDWGFSVLFPRL